MNLRRINCNIFLLLLLFSCNNNDTNSVVKNEIDRIKCEREKKLVLKVNELKKFIMRHHEFNDSIVFMVNMNIPSNNFRFYVYDLKKDKIISRGLVAHGAGSRIQNSAELKFSNAENSNCTSLGRYVVSKSYVGKFGKSYQLIGLDSTNNNSLKRAIILHKYSSVPDYEQSYPIVLSLGCPMVSYHFFSSLESIIDHSRKKIILDIFY